MFSRKRIDPQRETQQRQTRALLGFVVNLDEKVALCESKRSSRLIIPLGGTLPTSFQKYLEGKAPLKIHKNPNVTAYSSINEALANLTDEYFVVYDFEKGEITSYTDRNGNNMLRDLAKKTL